jgi:hypothetical protein
MIKFLGGLIAIIFVLIAALYVIGWLIYIPDRCFSKAYIPQGEECKNLFKKNEKHH